MLRLFNTLTKKKEVFKPIESGMVKMYHCGPTVYDRAHIGNLRSYVFADILRRTLEFEGLEVTQVINITDVGHLMTDEDTGEDKMMKALRREDKEITLENMREIALKYEGAFVEDLGNINALLPHHMPRASEHIAEDIELIEALEKRGAIYKTSDGIYFDTSKMSEYGKLGGLSDQGESRVEENKEKRNQRDFALWKFSQNLGFGSPWGTGFPGWHIECSAMSRKYLGQPFDIHTGGIDHIPVHHNNEIAQSECAYGKPLANYWLHNAHIKIEEEKIAKSLGNTLTLEDLKSKDFSPLAYRYYLLGIHYRKEASFSWDALSGAEKALDRLRRYIAEGENDGIVIESKIKIFKEAVEDDLNTPEALAALWETARDDKLSKRDKRATLLEMDKVLGLRLDLGEKTVEIPEEIQELARKREEARNTKDWRRADELRAKVREAGFEIKDGDKGFEIIPQR